jgi:hypothetical protein
LGVFVKRSLTAIALIAAAAAALPQFLPATALARLDDDHDHKQTSLGKTMIGPYEVEALLDGKVEAGKETEFELKLHKGSPEPKAIRAWIGIESGRGSVKAKSHKHGDEISIHCEAPDPIPADAKLWIELETEQGKEKGSLPIKPA